MSSCKGLLCHCHSSVDDLGVITDANLLMSIESDGTKATVEWDPPRLFEVHCEVSYTPVICNNGPTGHGNSGALAFFMQIPDTCPTLQGSYFMVNVLHKYWQKTVKKIILDVNLKIGKVILHRSMALFCSTDWRHILPVWSPEVCDWGGQLGFYYKWNCSGSHVYKRKPGRLQVSIRQSWL